jgi:pimeloyl-ACP methyl ester carboxylesterase
MELPVPQAVATAVAIKAASITTGDNCSLAYSQQGPDNGKPLLFIHGWRQTAAQWAKQVSHFSEAGFRVTTYDMRGHGDSEKPPFGYRISRLAADLNDLLTTLQLKGLTIVAHSMGCCVLWAFWDQYPDSHKLVKRLVLVDEPATLVSDPNWPEGKDKERAAIFTPDAVFNTAHNMADGLLPLIRSMFSSSITEEEFEWVMEQNRKINDKNAAALLIDHAFNDWSDVLPRINVPTLVISGEISILPAAGVNWVASQIPGAKHYTFSTMEKGSHFMFWENYERFNSLVEGFLLES